MEREHYNGEGLNKVNQTEEMSEEIKNKEGEMGQASDEEMLEDQDKEGIEEDKQEEEISEVDQLQLDLTESKDKYLRLYSEFENFRRRTAKERMELVKTANEDMMVVLLPIKDDFERALKAAEESEESKLGEEGLQIIHNKLSKVLEQKGLKEMETQIGDDFDSEVHDAITQIPAPDESLKGKIADVIEKGYYLNDKVIRYAKVVIGS